MVYMEMHPYLTHLYGNPGSVHVLGVESKKALDKARARVAKAINAEPDEIIFTSGGSEANNLMINSFGNNFLTDALSSETEHDSMIKSLENHFKGSVRYCNFYGTDLNSKTLDTDLVSAMYVNNELGFINPVYEIGSKVHTFGFFFITDCVQALGHEEIDVKKLGCDMLSLSSHKIHGPKGVGAVYVKRDMRRVVSPLIFGGGNQEFGLRGGTENVAGIVGFGKACEMINIDENKTTISKLRKEFLSGLKGDYRVNFDYPTSKIISLTFPGIDAETLVLMLSSMGVYISAGSACKSLEQKPNEVLLAAGFSESDARSTVRISLSCYNTIDEMKSANKIINECTSVLKMNT